MTAAIGVLLEMSDAQTFIIDLKSFDKDITELRFNIDDGFFENIEEPKSVARGALDANVTITKVGRSFELRMRIVGEVVVPCDICLKDMRQPIETDTTVTVRLGEEYSDEGDIITVDESDGTLDLAWMAYENIVLAMPMRHVHEESECDPDMLKLLSENSARHDDESETEVVDSRWKALEKIKNNIKD